MFRSCLLPDRHHPADRAVPGRCRDPRPIAHHEPVNRPVRPIEVRRPVHPGIVQVTAPAAVRGPAAVTAPAVLHVHRRVRGPAVTALPAQAEVPAPVRVPTAVTVHPAVRGPALRHPARRAFVDRPPGPPVSLHRVRVPVREVRDRPQAVHREHRGPHALPIRPPHPAAKNPLSVVFIEIF